LFNNLFSHFLNSTIPPPHFKTLRNLRASLRFASLLQRLRFRPRHLHALRLKRSQLALEFRMRRLRAFHHLLRLKK
jgi:hypothetical protein